MTASDLQNIREALKSVKDMSAQANLSRMDWRATALQMSALYVVHVTKLLEELEPSPRTE